MYYDWPVAESAQGKYYEYPPYHRHEHRHEEYRVRAVVVLCTQREGVSHTRADTLDAAARAARRRSARRRRDPRHTQHAGTSEPQRQHRRRVTWSSTLSRRTPRTRTARPRVIISPWSWCSSYCPRAHLQERVPRVSAPAPRARTEPPSNALDYASSTPPHRTTRDLCSVNWPHNARWLQRKRYWRSSLLNAAWNSFEEQCSDRVANHKIYSHIATENSWENFTGRKAPEIITATHISIHQLKEPWKESEIINNEVTKHIETQTAIKERRRIDDTYNKYLFLISTFWS